MMEGLLAVAGAFALGWYTASVARNFRFRSMVIGVLKDEIIRLEAQLAELQVKEDE